MSSTKDSTTRLKIFSSRLQERMKAVGKNQRTLCAELGRSHSFLTPFVKGMGSPRLVDSVELSKALNTSPNYLVGFDEIQPVPKRTETKKRLLDIVKTVDKAVLDPGSKRPTIERMMFLYTQGKGRLEAFSSANDYYDLFLPPSLNGKPVMYNAGPLSLASATINRLGRTDNAQHIQFLLDNIDSDEFHDKMKRDYVNAELNGFHNSIEEMDVQTPDGPYRATYSRSLFYVHDKSPKKYILNFSKLIG